MNSQDITHALIDTTVARAMVEMDADPKRSVRKLCDLGRQFSRGRFQNQIFAIFQDLLRNDESPYYQAIDFLLRSNDPEALRQFGINIGYNSFTYGAQILRQKQKELSFAVATYFCLPDCIVAFVNFNSRISLDTVACVTLNPALFKRSANISCVSISFSLINSSIFDCRFTFIPYSKS